MSALILTQRLPVEPDVGQIGHRAETQPEPAIPVEPERHVEACLVPGRAEEVAQVFKLLVPTGGNRDDASATKTGRPILLAPGFAGIWQETE
jgi:hypothetical protein